MGILENSHRLIYGKDTYERFIFHTSAFVPSGLAAVRTIPNKEGMVISMDFKVPNTKFYGVPFRTEDFNGMPYRRLGETGLKVSNVGLGTWKMGYPETGDGSRIDERTSLAILDRALALGVTFWDTANRYNEASGNAERILGTWFQRNPDQRRNIVLCTKLCGGMDGISPNHGGLSRVNILESTYASLERMELDYVDVMYFHREDTDTPIHEILMAMEDLIRQDLVRYFAVSNFDEKTLDRYRQALCSVTNRCRITAVQNQYDIIRGESDGQHVLEYCKNEGISFIAYSPLGRGLLTERYLDPAKAGPGDRLYDEKALSAFGQEAFEKARRLHKLASEWKLTLSQLALSYMLTLPGMGPVIPSSSTVAQLELNASAGSIRLDSEQIVAIRAALC